MTYRVVVDFNYGDKAIVKSGLSEEDAMIEVAIQRGCNDVPSLSECKDTSSLYYMEYENYEWDNNPEWS